jgi:hypothetical protein
MNQHEIPQVDKRANSLPGHEDWIPSMNGVGEHDEASGKAHIPKCYRHLTLGLPLRGNPLNYPPRKKEALAKKSDAKPKTLYEGQCRKVGANIGEKFVHEKLGNVKSETTTSEMYLRP